MFNFEKLNSQSTIKLYKNQIYIITKQYVSKVYFIQKIIIKTIIILIHIIF